MKSLYDLTAHPSLQQFPWEDTFVGLASAHKSVTTFYGDVHSTQYQHTAKGWKDKNSWRWYNALKHGVQVEGFNVNVTGFIGDWWWARMHEANVWQRTGNAEHFGALFDWLRICGMFESTGRILFFLQLKGAGSPQHTDFDPSAVPVHLREPTEFLWLTPPDNPKQLTVDGQEAPYACWFNHFLPHGSAAADRPQWSLRVDGKFTPSFRASLEQQ